MSKGSKHRSRLTSINNALSGLFLLIRSQINARIHLCATLIVLIAGLSLPLSRHDWIGLLFAILIVWLAEALNTALELLADALHPTHHPGIGKAKDMAAGAVLIAAIGASLIGLLIFVPHIKHLLN